MSSGGAWLQLAKLLGGVVAVFGACTYAFVSVVHVGESPLTPDEFIGAVFFSIQTITTTGYGFGFPQTLSVIKIASIFMVIGSITWGIFIAQVAVLFTTQLFSKQYFRLLQEAQRETLSRFFSDANIGKRA